jgi:hypothetical protein
MINFTFWVGWQERSISFQKDFLSFHSGHTISRGSISNCLLSDSKTYMWK